MQQIRHLRPQTLFLFTFMMPGDAIGCYVTYLYFETPWASKRSESQTFQTQIFGRPVPDIKATLNSMALKWVCVRINNGAPKLHGYGCMITLGVLNFDTASNENGQSEKCTASVRSGMKWRLKKCENMSSICGRGKSINTQQIQLLRIQTANKLRTWSSLSTPAGLPAKWKWPPSLWHQTPY